MEHPHPHPQHQLPQHQPPLHAVQYAQPVHQSQQLLQHQHQRPQHARNDMPYVGVKNGNRYRLSVEQQPIRARMCGFGDKDRRPITPPPCVRLIVVSDDTGSEIEIEKVDSTFCILQVDLWNEDCTQAVNLVRHSSASPTVSISSSTVASYPPPPERLFMPPPPGSQWTSQQIQAYGQQHAMPTHAAYATQYSAGGYSYPSGLIGITSPLPNQHYTRNLIGMNAVNACRLNDLDNKPGFWFVLQDLSVRTEGTFRLKFTMSDIGLGQGTNGVSQGKCPVLATAFSEPFTVYSAKKFPGVVESTPLSKCLASQGIKIPIRKDGKERGNQAEYDADD